MIPAKLNKVYFINNKIKTFFDELARGTSADKELYSLISRAMDDLEENPFRYIKIPRSLWPVEYAKLYKVKNLWKYDLPNGWRLIYTLREDKIEIMSIILEWFSHKKYERKFGY